MLAHPLREGPRRIWRFRCSDGSHTDSDRGNKMKHAGLVEKMRKKGTEVSRNKRTWGSVDDSTREFLRAKEEGCIPCRDIVHAPSASIRPTLVHKNARRVHNGVERVEVYIVSIAIKFTLFLHLVWGSSPEAYRHHSMRRNAPDLHIFVFWLG